VRLVYTSALGRHSLYTHQSMKYVFWFFTGAYTNSILQAHLKHTGVVFPYTHRCDITSNAPECRKSKLKNCTSYLCPKLKGAGILISKTNSKRCLKVNNIYISSLFSWNFEGRETYTEGVWSNQIILRIKFC